MMDKETSTMNTVYSRVAPKVANLHQRKALNTAATNIPSSSLVGFAVAIGFAFRLGRGAAS